jgi:hypothetical protein
MRVAAASAPHVLARCSTTLAYAQSQLLHVSYATTAHKYRHRHTVSSRRTFTSLPQPTTSLRPFTFHVGASFIGKPVMNDDPLPVSKPFPSDHPIVAFRDKMLAWPREVPSEEAGHDFFFVQDVC